MGVTEGSVDFIIHSLSYITPFCTLLENLVSFLFQTESLFEIKGRRILWLKVATCQDEQTTARTLVPIHSSAGCLMQGTSSHFSMCWLYSALHMSLSYMVGFVECVCGV